MMEKINYMTNFTEQHHENLAQKLKGKELSLVTAIREYLASIAGVQKCSDQILKAFQGSHDNAMNVLENNHTTKK